MIFNNNQKLRLYIHCQRGCGGTTFIRKILAERKYDEIFASPQQHRDLADLGELMIHQYSSNVYEQIFNKNTEELRFFTESNKRYCMIFDSSDKLTAYDLHPFLSNIDVIYISQYPIDYKEFFATNFVIFRETSEQCLKRICDLVRLPDFEHERFIKKINDLVNYQVLLVDDINRVSVFENADN